MSKKKWIGSAIKRPGAFSRWCRGKGYKSVTAACIAEGKRSSNATTRRRASLAQTLSRMRRRRK